MDTASTIALAVVIDHTLVHELPSLVQELMLERERKAMQLEDLAVQGLTGRLFANVDLAHEPDEDLGPVDSWDDLVTDYAAEVDFAMPIPR